MYSWKPRLLHLCMWLIRTALKNITCYLKEYNSLSSRLHLNVELFSIYYYHNTLSVNEEQRTVSANHTFMWPKMIQPIRGKSVREIPTIHSLSNRTKQTKVQLIQLDRNRVNSQWIQFLTSCLPARTKASTYNRHVTSYPCDITRCTT